VVGLLRRDDGGVGAEGEVDAGVGHQVGLELRQIHVQLAVEAQGGGDGGHALREQAVQVGVRGALDVEVAAADVVQRLVVDEEGDVRVLQHRVRAQHGVVGLHHDGGDLGGGVHGELDLGLLAVVDGQTVQQQGAEAGAGAAAEGVEDHEALQTRAVVRQLARAVQHQVDDLLACNGGGVGEGRRGGGRER